MNFGCGFAPPRPLTAGDGRADPGREAGVPGAGVLLGVPVGVLFPDMGASGAGCCEAPSTLIGALPAPSGSASLAAGFGGILVVGVIVALKVEK